ncbi:ATP-binding protein, partial [Oleiphilus sp. HI0079]
DIGNLVADIASSVACVAEDKQLEIVLDISDVSDRGIVGDPGRTRQILNNLIGNAIKFTNHGHVLISATTSVNEDGKCICEITIKDTGVGIPKDRVNVIFDAFSQVDASTTRKFGGTGLGLTICKQLAELLDGDITVTSEIGRGSEFTFKFAAELAKSQPKAAEHSEFSEISVAHLDATAPCLESVKRQLGKWGVESSQFCEPDSLLSEIRSKHFDIVLISAGIPAL